MAALSLKTALSPMLQESAVAPDFVRRIEAWDGRYGAEESGPVLFEALLYQLATRLYAKDGNVPGDKSDWSYLVHYLPQDLAARQDRKALVDASISAAQETSRKYPTWGDMHRLRVSHILSNVPGIGGSFVVDEFGVSGSRNTVMKTAHGLVNGRHYASYGSQARQLVDMADPDRNSFVLFGGEDGWLGSANYADQVALWRQGRAISMPLTAAKVEAEFPTQMMLRPGVRP